VQPKGSARDGKVTGVSPRRADKQDGDLPGRVAHVPLTPARRRVVQGRIAACLALTAGYVDAYGLFVLGTYVSFMSGNSTTTAVELGKGEFGQAVSPAIAIPGFVAGSLAGTLVTHMRWRQPHRILFAAIAAMLAAALGLGAASAPKEIEIAGLSFAMGMVNPALSHVGLEKVSLTFMTGALSRLGSHLALGLRRAPVAEAEGDWDTHFHRALLDARLWVTFVLGAVLCIVATSALQSLALAPAIAVMLALSLFCPTEAAEAA
jgi:uncharacterized membrane protein YoaK (UPF0700 family)